VPAGYVELDRRPAPDIDIAFFGLVPEFIGQGLGRYLLGWAVAEAWRQTPRLLKVNTNNFDHPRALPNYQKAGFVPVRQENEFIDDPREKGLIPRHVPVRG
jgi:GNAT superfamily N-acetyltransferase